MAKIYREQNVLEASQERISFVFDNFSNIYVSFSGGKDSTFFFYLLMDEGKKKKREIGVLLIDFEAQYDATISHAERMFKKYQDYIEPHWVCLPIKLRNAVSNFEPTCELS